MGLASAFVVAIKISAKIIKSKYRTKGNFGSIFWDVSSSLTDISISQNCAHQHAYQAKMALREKQHKSTLDHKLVKKALNSAPSRYFSVKSN